MVSPASGWSSALEGRSHAAQRAEDDGVGSPTAVLAPARIHPADEALLRPPTTETALTAELALFRRRLEEVIATGFTERREREDRRESWLLFGAITVVLIFCLVAFYLTQSELRDVRSTLEDEIVRAGHATQKSIERSIVGFQLDRIPEAQGSLEKFLCERDRRESERVNALVGQVVGQLGKQMDAAQRDFRSLSGEIAALKAATTPSPEPRMVLGPLFPETWLMDSHLNTLPAGWAARTPDGPSVSALPVPEARPSSPNPSSKAEADGGAANPP